MSKKKDKKAIFYKINKKNQQYLVTHTLSED